MLFAIIFATILIIFTCRYALADITLTLRCFDAFRYAALFARHAACWLIYCCFHRLILISMLLMPCCHTGRERDVSLIITPLRHAADTVITLSVIAYELLILLLMPLYYWHAVIRY